MSDPIDVAVNLLWLAPGRVGGSEHYLVRQLAGLPDDAGIAPRLLTQRAFVDAHPDLAARYPTVVQPVDRDWRGLRMLAEHTWLTARTRRADLVHHGGGTVPIGAPRPVLLTVHDLQYLALPHNFSSARLAYLRAMMPRSVRRARVIATPSEFVRGTVIDAFGVEPERVVVVPHGVPAADLPEDRVTAARARFGLDRCDYLVYPAITHPHKGHRVLIDMIAELDLTLVLIGGAGAAEGALAAAIAESPAHERIVRLGRVAEDDRDALVAGAAALVFPSEYEGFGAPLVEAMEVGTPVVCGSHPAIREVVGEAAVIVTERTGPAWAAAVREALDRRDELVAAGRIRRSRFTLEQAGAALASAYRQAVAR